MASNTTNSVINSFTETFGESGFIDSDDTGFVVTIEGWCNKKSYRSRCLPIGRIRGAIKNKTVSEAQLKLLIASQIEDEKRLAEVFKEAKNYGASIEEIKVGARGGVQFRVRREDTGGSYAWWNLTRARENCWGNKFVLFGQSSIFSLLQSAWPEVTWMYNDRDLLPGNRELDILGNINGQYLAIEFQGHQSHRKHQETIENDRWKQDFFKKNKDLGILVVVEPPKQYTFISIYEQLCHAIKEQAASYYPQIANLDPSIEVHRLPRTVSAILRKRHMQLLKSMKSANPEHQLISNEKATWLGEKIEYQCGYCGLPATVSIKNVITDFPTGCKKCRPQRVSARNTQSREETCIDLLGIEQWNRLPSVIKAQLTATGRKDGIKCPKCNNIQYIDTALELVIQDIKDHRGFHCWFCHNKGHALTNEPAIAGVIKQSYSSIIELIQSTRMGKVEKWFDYIELKSSRYKEHSESIQVSLPCGKTSKVTCRPLSEWKKLLRESKRRNQYQIWCDCCGLGGGNYKPHHVYDQQVQRYHPNGSLRNRTPDRESDKSNKNQNKTYICGESLMFGNVKLVHPPFVTRPNRLVQQQGPYCFICHENVRLLSNFNMKKNSPSTPKSLNFIRKWWLNRVGMLGILQQRIDFSGVTVEVVGAPNFDESNIIDTKNTELNFVCGSAGHKPVKATFDNMRNKAKTGCCSSCLNDTPYIANSYAQILRISDVRTKLEPKLGIDQFLKLMR